MISREGAKVLIGPSSFAETDRAPLERLSASGLEVIPNPFKRKLTREELLNLLDKDVIGIIAGLEPLDREVLERSQLKVISRCGSGMSNVDLETARKKGIRVYSTPLGPVTAVAELTIGSLLCLLRGIHLSNSSMHQERWFKPMGRQLLGKRAVLIGFGRIGRQVGQLLLAFGVEVIAVDPLYRNDNPGIRKAELTEALRSADIITLHCSGNQVILGRKEFDLMKNGVIILNAARGGLISEEALLEALEKGKVAGAWLDAFREEPYQGPLCRSSRVLLTSHIGSYTAECRRAMELEAVDNLLQAF
ncbi:MAG: phosphoglycerate dehydrogenase [Deltaproteobacteria bacterium]|nr:phosphoglycerate dehydrogenase [Deltaproteobacteria bacterium]